MTEDPGRLTPEQRDLLRGLEALVHRLGAPDQLHLMETGTMRDTGTLAVISHVTEERTVLYVDVTPGGQVEVTASDDVWMYGDVFEPLAYDEALMLIEDVLRYGVALEFRRRGPFTQNIKARVPTDPPRALHATELVGIWRALSRMLPMKERTVRDRITPFVERGD